MIPSNSTDAVKNKIILKNVIKRVTACVIAGKANETVSCKIKSKRTAFTYLKVW